VPTLRLSRIGIFSVILWVGSIEVWSAEPEALPSPAPSASPTEKPKTAPKKVEPKKANWSAEIIRKQTEEDGIQNLTFAQTKIPVTLMPSEEVLRPLVEIQGNYNRPGWRLFSLKDLLIESHPGKTEFKLYAYLNSKSNQISLTAQGPDGETETEKVVIFAPEAQEYRIASPWGELLFSLGLSSLSYYQTGFGDFSSKTGIVSLTYTTPKWKLPLGVYSQLKTTQLTLSANPSNYGPQIIAGKLDATYLLPPKPTHKVHTRLVAGLTYLTLLSNGSPFGFANLIAPEFGARAFYPLKKKDSGFTGDLRIAPLGSLSGIAEYGIDLGLGWTTPLKNYHRIEVNLFYSDFAYQADSSTKIQTKLLSLTFGYTI
jgi:hypothetical protein